MGRWLQAPSWFMLLTCSLSNTAELVVSAAAEMSLRFQPAKVPNDPPPHDAPDTPPPLLPVCCCYFAPALNNRQPGEDPFTQMRQEKRERIKTQHKQQLANVKQAAKAGGAAAVPATLRLASALPSKGRGKPTKRKELRDEVRVSECEMILGGEEG